MYRSVSIETIFNGGPCVASGWWRRYANAGASGSLTVRSFRSVSRCGSVCRFSDVLSNCIGSDCLGSAAAATLNLLCMDLDNLASNLPQAALDCTVGGCPAAAGGVPFCQTHFLGIVECASNVILSCTGPYGKGIPSACIDLLYSIFDVFSCAF